jgi:hypothetical protein
VDYTLLEGGALRASETIFEEETGECGERQLNHSDGEAERFYRDLQQRGIQCV